MLGAAPSVRREVMADGVQGKENMGRDWNVCFWTFDAKLQSQIALITFPLGSFIVQ